MTDTIRASRLIEFYNKMMNIITEDIDKIMFIQAFDALQEQEKMKFTFNEADFDRILLRMSKKTTRSGDDGGMSKYARVVFESEVPDNASDEDILDVIEKMIEGFISNPWDMSAVEIHGRPYEADDVKTTENYWDCECKENYIHPKEQKVCFKCGAAANSQPDSRVDEVVKYGFPL